ncbi:hypothetical protein LJK88_49485 [Paenibacillus sp. P26]|nr:hypothetical protein LJK88_49485 [Paenibacillus sp. P26]UUZ91523.1 hypothetical protein LJK87_38870 [Paenibacillus sp. P25]
MALIAYGARKVAPSCLIYSILFKDSIILNMELGTNTVNEVTSRIEEISASAQQIAVGTGEVVKSSSLVSEVSAISSQETQTVSGATEE